MLDDLLPLPMDMPEMAPPTIPRMNRPASITKPEIAPTLPTMVVVDANLLQIDDRFGLDAAALTVRYTQEIADARTRLEQATPQTLYPSVLSAGDDRYTAFNGIPVVLAALELARASNTAVLVTVLLHEAVDGDALLHDVFENPRGKSLFEKARYIAGCEAKYGTRRAWMRAEGIAPEKWEPRFSKIAKIGRLDKRLLAAIDPHTIANAEVACRIVDACADPATRRIVLDMTEAAAATTTSPLNAGPLFKRIDAVLHPRSPAFASGGWSSGVRELRGADGSVVATLTRDGPSWSIAGSDVAGVNRALLRSAFDAFTT